MVVHETVRWSVGSAAGGCPLTRRWSGPRRRYTSLAVERRACAAAAAQRWSVMPREDLAVTTADEQRGWRLALAEMVERGLQKLARGEGIGGLHIDDLLPLEQVRAMGR